MCGLIKRHELEHADLGYALLTDYHKQGYAKEAAFSILKNGFDQHNLDTIVAITSMNNAPSNQLLLKFGFTFMQLITFHEHKTNLYAIKA
ncbi:MAG: RimJ/RimL family protein N-acetyltransferase [Oceanospirillaceae bacterium]|jgi:RimJ/RimL family protein N-acetyltransferase